MALTNKLTAIADAIRAKTGGTAALTLPQMAAAIADLPVGTWFGSYTPSTDIISTNGFTINHNLGAVPDIVVCWCDELPDLTKQSILGVVYMTELTDLITEGGSNAVNGFIAYTTSAQAYNGGPLTSASYVGALTENSCTIKGNSSGRYFRAGTKYNVALVSTAAVRA